jgi:hypothetical protein
MAAPTKATLVWHRHIANAGPYLNDLDLHLYEETTGLLQDSSVSGVDNVEQVATNEAGASVLVVEASGTFKGSEEVFALAHSGEFDERQGPDLGVSIVSAPVAGRVSALRPGESTVVTWQLRSPNATTAGRFDIDAVAHCYGSSWRGSASVPIAQ